MRVGMNILIAHMVIPAARTVKQKSILHTRDKWFKVKVLSKVNSASRHHNPWSRDSPRTFWEEYKSMLYYICVCARAIHNVYRTAQLYVICVPRPIWLLQPETGPGLISILAWTQMQMGYADSVLARPKLHLSLIVWVILKLVWTELSYCLHNQYTNSWNLWVFETTDFSILYYRNLSN